jgi:hypothetical protein
MRRSCSCTVIVAGLLVAGCSGAKLPSLPEIAEAFTPYPVVGPPTDIYARIARGALACWFGTGGPLKTKYIYHADADPPAKGGKAEIFVHERDNTKETLRGTPAFHVLITPDGESSTVAVENLNLAKPLAVAMEQDVHRWAAGSVGCATDGGAWKADAPPAEPPGATDAPKKNGNGA